MRRAYDDKAKVGKDVQNAEVDALRKLCVSLNAEVGERRCREWKELVEGGEGRGEK